MIRLILIFTFLIVNLSQLSLAKIASVIGDPMSKEIFFEINKRFSSELKTELLNSKLNSSVKNDLAGFTRFIKAKY